MTTSRAGVDWEELKRAQLLRCSQFVDNPSVDPERLRQAFRRRAERLAQRGSRQDQTGALAQVLVFRAGTELCAIELGHVAQIFSWQGVTPIPGEPASLLGVTYLLGEVRSVIDLARLMKTEPALPGGGKLLLIEVDDARVAVRVDGLEGVRWLDLGRLLTIESDAEGRSQLFRGRSEDGVSVLAPAGIRLHHERQRTAAGSESRGAGLMINSDVAFR